MNHDSAYSSFQALAEKEIHRIMQAGHLDEESALAHDLRIVCQLVDSERYTLNDIAEALMKGTLRQQTTTDPDVLLSHVDRVLANVNRVRFTATTGAYKYAQRSYRRHVAAMMNQYRDYSKDSYGMFHDGIIALELLRKEGYSMEVVDTVLRKNTFFPDADEEYFKELLGNIHQTMERYGAIESVDVDADFQDAADMYRKYAKKYMEETGAKILSAKDEQRIARQIYADLLRSYESEMPKRIGKEDIRRFHDDMEEIIKPAIQEALELGSPVTTEAGRDKYQYIESVLMSIQGMAERPRSYDEEINEAKNDFDARMDTLLRKRRESIHAENQEILDDCIIAKELLEAHRNPIIIAKSIADRSSVANSPQNPQSSASLYGKWVVACAKDSLHAERGILYSKDESPKAEYDSYEQLKEQGFHAKRLYILALAERIHVYPSFAMRLSERETDVDACEKLLARYRDIDRFDLKEAIREFSPRAKLAGIGADYAARVIELAARRLRETSQRESNVNQLRTEYNRLRGLASEGILSENPMNTYKDGKVAVQMLKKNENPDDIMEIVRSMAVAAGIAVPEIYAANIVESAKEVVARGKSIEEYEPEEGASPTIVDDYMQLIKDRYRSKKFPTAEMDITVVKKLILRNKYKKGDIQDVVETCSPNAAEPGRDRHYKEYVYDVAMAALETEKTKLKNYKAILRPQETSLESEVAFQRQAIHETIELPHSPDMDVPIVEALLASKRYDTNDIVMAIASGFDKAYAVRVMESAEKSMEQRSKEKSKGREKSQDFVRTRTKDQSNYENDDLDDA